MALDELRQHVDELSAEVGVIAEIQQDGSQVFIILRAVPLPPGAYKVDTTDVLFIADAQYPLSAMDMFWTDVEVLRADGSVPQAADSIETYAGRQWRRFSWHRNGIWKPSGNPLLDHYEFIRDRFNKDALP